LRTCWSRSPARSPGVRTATAIIFFPTSIGRPARRSAPPLAPFGTTHQARRPRNPHEHQESETRARKGGNPEYPTGAGSSVNLWYGLNPRQGRTTSAADTPPSFNDPRALRQRHQDLWWSWVTPAWRAAGEAGSRCGGQPVWRAAGVGWLAAAARCSGSAAASSRRDPGSTGPASTPPDAPLHSATSMVNRTPRSSALDQKERTVQLTMKPTHLPARPATHHPWPAWCYQAARQAGCGRQDLPTVQLGNRGHPAPTCAVSVGRRGGRPGRRGPRGPASRPAGGVGRRDAAGDQSGEQLVHPVLHGRLPSGEHRQQPSAADRLADRRLRLGGRVGQPLADALA